MAMISLSKQHCLTCSPVVLLGESALGDPTGGQVLATHVYIGGFTCEGRSPGVGWQLMASVIGSLQIEHQSDTMQSQSI